MRSTARGTQLLSISALVFLGACTGGLTPTTTGPPSTTQPSPATTSTTEENSEAIKDSPDLSILPERAGPRRQTTGDVPHQQLDAEPVPEVDAELRRRIFALPGVEDRASERSLPGARGLWFTEGLELVRSDVLGGAREGVLGSTREFAHIHPDGSLHVWLPVERAIEVHESKWGELHPWVDREGFWDGVVMVYVPESADDLEIAVRIVVDAYNFITGENLKTDDIP
jgi:phospholipase/carboxylesterase